MPEAFSTPNLVALPITSQELARGAFLPPPTKIVLSNSPTTIGLNNSRIFTRKPVKSNSVDLKGFRDF